MEETNIPPAKAPAKRMTRVEMVALLDYLRDVCAVKDGVCVPPQTGPNTIATDDDLLAMFIDATGADASRYTVHHVSSVREEFIGPLPGSEDAMADYRAEIDAAGKKISDLQKRVSLLDQRTKTQGNEIAALKGQVAALIDTLAGREKAKETPPSAQLSMDDA